MTMVGSRRHSIVSKKCKMSYVRTLTATRSERSGSLVRDPISDIAMVKISVRLSETLYQEASKAEKHRDGC